MAPRVLFGSYELLERIGEGGMAEVWRARSRGVAGFEKEVVIKRVLPSLMARPDFARLLIHEAKVAARFNHPNIVQIFELGEEQGAYFIAMELVQGCDLATALRAQPDPLDAGRGLSLPLRLMVVLEAARALEYAHRQLNDDGQPLGVVHRDVSPQNILLGYEGQVKVADFGIALAHGLGAAEEDGRKLRGKYAYMSPEQAQADVLDHRSDIFSLGIVLYELMAGRRLFRADTPAQTLERVIEANVPRLQLDILGLPQLQEILDRSLEPDRERRYANAGLMADALSRVLVELDARVGRGELGDTVSRVTPPTDRRNANANKARLSLFNREPAHLLMSPTPIVLTDATVALTTSKRLRMQERAALVVMFAVDVTAVDGEELAALAAQHRGVLLPLSQSHPQADPQIRYREAVFGYREDAEHAAEHAARFALGLRRAAPATWGTLVRGRVHMVDEAAQPLEETRALAREHLVEGVSFQPSLREELRWHFHVLEPRHGRWPLLGEVRSRAEREMQHRRQDGALIGRGAELDALLAAYQRAVEGEGCAALVVGAPGTGKSRLVAEVVHAATCDDALVLAAHGRAATPGPYGALVELFADLCGCDGNDDAETVETKVRRLRVLGLGETVIAEVAALLQGRSGSGTRAGPRPIGRPRALVLIRALDRAVQALSADGRPLVVVLDDIHWMDDESRQLLNLVSASFTGRHALALMTARPGVALPPLRDVLRIELERLDEAASARLLASRLGGARYIEVEIHQALETECRGNPEGIVQLANLLRGHPETASDAQVIHRVPPFEELAIPEGMATAVAARASTLPTDAQEILAACAALGDHARTDVLALCAAQSGASLRGPLLGLLTSQWLQSTDPDSLRFDLTGRWGGSDDVSLPRTVSVHGGELARRCVLAWQEPRELAKVHASAVDALSLTGASARVLAHHAVRAGLPDGAAFCRRAADEAAGEGMKAEAARWLLRACHAGGDVSRGQIVRGAVAAAEAALDAGDVALVASALALVPPEAPLRQETTTADDSEHGTAIEEDAYVRAGIVRARVDARAHRWSEAVAELERQRARVARSHAPDAGLSAQLQLALGRALLETGSVERAVESLQASVASFAQVQWRGELGVARGEAYCAMAKGWARLGNREGAETASREALRLAARYGELRLRWRALHTAALVADAFESAGSEVAAPSKREGAWIAPMERWIDAAELAREEELTECLARSAVGAAVACVRVGRDDQAAVWAEAAGRSARQSNMPAVLALAETVRSLLAVTAHPDPHFVKALVQNVERLELLGRKVEASVGLDMLALAHEALGDVGAAIRTLGRAVASAQAAGHQSLAHRLRTRAEALARGEARAAPR